MKVKQLFEQLIARQNLSEQQMQETTQSLMNGELTDCQTTAFLALMRMKGETVEELTTAAKTMREFAHSLDLGSDLLDIVGTGGDGQNTFNVSTACSFVVAASGIKVAKHGNRSVSSQSGSADLLENAGFKLGLGDLEIKHCIDKLGIAFLFAPQYHPAMKHARTARQELGIRTLFNLLGPLLNPAEVKRQVIGVFGPQWQQTVADVLVNLGSERVLVVHSDDGLDEISIAAPTAIVEYKQGRFNQWILNPDHFGLAHSSLKDIVVTSPAESLKLVLSVLEGKSSAARDIVLLNSAAAIYCADDQLSFENALDKAKLAIDNGKAYERFNQLQQLTVTLANE